MPAKWILFGAACFFVCFPHVGLLRRHVARLRDLQSLIEPDAPEIAVLREELLADWDKYQPDLKAAGSQTALPADDMPARLVLRTIERFVYQKVVYAWDWDLWGNADYVPTVHEMFAQPSWRRQGICYEDCDGRAVVAASLMKRMGYNASLVTDLRHVWVATPEGEWMGPGGAKTLQATPHGNVLAWGTVWTNLRLSLSYGVAVFPLGRELVILATAYALMLHRRMSRRWAAAGAVLLLQSLLFLRCVGALPTPGGTASTWPATIGLIHLAAGTVVLMIASRRARQQSRETEGPANRMPVAGPRQC
jgi:hypothetical protein